MCVCVCVWVWVGVHVGVCVGVCEREREREISLLLSVFSGDLRLIGQREHLKIPPPFPLDNLSTSRLSHSHSQCTNSSNHSQLSPNLDSQWDSRYP